MRALLGWRPGRKLEGFKGQYTVILADTSCFDVAPVGLGSHGDNGGMEIESGSINQEGWLW